MPAFGTGTLSLFRESCICLVEVQFPVILDILCKHKVSGHIVASWVFYGIRCVITCHYMAFKSLSLDWIWSAPTHPICLGSFLILSFVCIHTYTHTHTHTHTYIYIYICMCVCVCVCVYINSFDAFFITFSVQFVLHFWFLTSLLQ